MTQGAPPALLIYTDASVHGASQSGSWGAVIRGPQGEIHKSGAFKAQCKCSAQAELQGVANALHMVLTDRLPDRTQITVMCDNLAVVNVLSGRNKFKAKSAHLRELAQIVLEKVAGSSANVRFVWVKGHQSLASGCPHAAGNRTADLLARMANPVMATYKAKRAAQRKRYKAARKARLACAREEAAKLPRLEPIGEPA